MHLQTLHDEIWGLGLEISQLEQRNTELKKDNASLLSRWIDKMNLEAEKLNEANLFYEDLKTQHDQLTSALGDLPTSGTKLSGNGVANGTGKSPATGSTLGLSSKSPNG